MDAFWSHDDAGLLIALSIVALGIALGLWGRKRRLRHAIPLLVVAVLVSLIGAVMTFGSARHVLQVADAARRDPPPGQLVDVGGYRIHIWCEGPTGSGAPVVWIPGLREEGLKFIHLHQRLRTDHRSCLIDRSGSGFSDVGRFPKSIESDVTEVSRALERSGERGPFVIAGHSLGGLLAENLAVRRPDLVSGLLLLDATPTDSWIYGQQTMCAPLVLLGRRGALLTQFGLWNWISGQINAHPNPFEKAALKSVAPILRDHDDRARNGRAMASAVATECAHPLSLVRFPGALRDLPITVIVPNEDFASYTKTSRAGFPQLDDLQFRNMFEIEQAGRRARAQLSSQTQFLYAPNGAKHNFPYTQAAFVEAQLRALLARVPVHGEAFTR